MVSRNNPNGSFQDSLSPQKTIATSSSRSHRGKIKTDILQVDPQELAQQLTLYESRLYSQIRARECLVWHKVQTGEAVQNLVAFAAHSNKLASWVKYSILTKDGLGRRADTVDRWIRVAEVINLLSSCPHPLKYVTPEVPYLEQHKLHL